MIESFSISSIFDIITKVISICFMYLLIGFFLTLLADARFRIGLKMATIP